MNIEYANDQINVPRQGSVLASCLPYMAAKFVKPVVLAGLVGFLLGEIPLYIIMLQNGIYIPLGTFIAAAFGYSALVWQCAAGFGARYFSMATLGVTRRNALLSILGVAVLGSVAVAVLLYLLLPLENALAVLLLQRQSVPFSPLSTLAMLAGVGLAIVCICACFSALMVRFGFKALAFVYLVAIASLKVIPKLFAVKHWGTGMFSALPPAVFPTIACILTAMAMGWAVVTLLRIDIP